MLLPLAPWLVNTFEPPNQESSFLLGSNKPQNPLVSLEIELWLGPLISIPAPAGSPAASGEPVHAGDLGAGRVPVHPPHLGTLFLASAACSESPPFFPELNVLTSCPPPFALETSPALLLVANTCASPPPAAIHHGELCSLSNVLWSSGHKFLPATGTDEVLEPRPESLHITQKWEAQSLGRGAFSVCSSDHCCFCFAKMKVLCSCTQKYLLQKSHA